MNIDKLLTKSLYLNGLQCKKSLWLNKYNSEELKEPDDATKAIFKTGEKVGCNSRSFKFFIYYQMYK